MRSRLLGTSGLDACGGALAGDVGCGCGPQKRSITIDANGLTRRQEATVIGSWSPDEMTLTTRLGVLESQRLPTSLLGDR